LPLCVVLVVIDSFTVDSTQGEHGCDKLLLTKKTYLDPFKVIIVDYEMCHHTDSMNYFNFSRGLLEFV